MEIEMSIPLIDLYLEYKMDMEALQLSCLNEEHPILARIPHEHRPKLPPTNTPELPTHLSPQGNCRQNRKTPCTCIACISECIQPNTERIHPLATTPWHDAELDKQECVQTFLLTNMQGESAKKQWSEDHIELMAENEDNLEFLVVYMDGSLMKKDRK